MRMNKKEEITRSIGHLGEYSNRNSSSSILLRGFNYTPTVLCCPSAKLNSYSFSCRASIWYPYKPIVHLKIQKKQNVCVSRLIIAFASFPKLLVYLVVRRCMTVIELFFEFFVVLPHFGLLLFRELLCLIDARHAQVRYFGLRSMVFLLLLALFGPFISFELDGGIEARNCPVKGSAKCAGGSGADEAGGENVAEMQR